jgi:hypothetical protein
MGNGKDKRKQGKTSGRKKKEDNGRGGKGRGSGKEINSSG